MSDPNVPLPTDSGHKKILGWIALLAGAAAAGATLLTNILSVRDGLVNIFQGEQLKPGDIVLSDAYVTGKRVDPDGGRYIVYIGYTSAKKLRRFVDCTPDLRIGGQSQLKAQDWTGSYKEGIAKDVYFSNQVTTFVIEDKNWATTALLRWECWEIFTPYIPVEIGEKPTD